LVGARKKDDYYLIHEVKKWNAAKIKKLIVRGRGKGWICIMCTFNISTYFSLFFKYFIVLIFSSKKNRGYNFPMKLKKNNTLW